MVMPLVRLLALSLFAGAVLGAALPGAAWWPRLAALACGAAALRVLPLRAGRRTVSMAARAAMVVVAGHALFGVSGAAAPPLTGAGESSQQGPLTRDWSEPRLVAFEGVVDGPVDVAASGEGEGLEARLTLRVSVPRVRSPPRWRVLIDRAERAPPVTPGSHVRIVGWAQPLHGPTNPGQFDSRPHLVRQGVVGFLRVPAGDALTLTASPVGGGALVARSSERIRAMITVRIDAALDPASGATGSDTATGRRAAALARCLLVGDRSRLDMPVRDAFRDAGLAHLLAVSGLHVVLLAGIAAGLLSLLLLRRPGLPVPGAVGPPAVLAFILLVGALVLYAAVCRFATPVVRAGVFLALAGLARLIGRRVRTLDLVSAAALLVLAHDPSQAVETGFLLSFTAVIGLAVLTPRLRQALFPSLALLEAFPESIPRWRFLLRRRLTTAVAASLAAWTATAPLLALRFGSLHPVGLLANVVAVPFAGPALLAAVVSACCGGALPAPARAACRAPLWLLEAMARTAAALPASTWSTAGVAGASALAAGLVLLAGARRRHWRRRDLLYPLAAIALLGLTAWTEAPASRRERARGSGPALPAEVVVLDVGHGLSVLLRGADGTDVLVDAGGLGSDVAARRILPALRALGVEELTALLVSHEDFDHCGEAVHVVDAVPTREVIVAEGFGLRAPAAALIAACGRLGVPVTRAARGMRLVRGGIDLRVLHPPPGTPGPIRNEQSLVVHARCTGAPCLDVLLPGDIQSDALAALAQDRTLPAAELLVLPHHGQADDELLDALARRCRARVLVASGAGRGPDPARAAAAGWAEYATSRDGAVRVRPGRPAECWPFPPGL